MSSQFTSAVCYCEPWQAFIFKHCLSSLLPVRAVKHMPPHPKQIVKASEEKRATFLPNSSHPSLRQPVGKAETLYCCMQHSMHYESFTQHIGSHLQLLHKKKINEPNMSSTSNQQIIAF